MSTREQLIEQIRLNNSAVGDEFINGLLNETVEIHSGHIHDMTDALHKDDLDGVPGIGPARRKEEHNELD